jgi:DNA-binding CsgD family transcriptional regulator
VISPVGADQRITLPGRHANEVIRSIGTERYGKVCFEVFEQPLAVDHWALFRFNSLETVNCIATASRSYTVAAQENINRYAGRCHSVDPSLSAVKSRPMKSACVVKMSLTDIRDGHYRSCFNSTHVQERLSFFHQNGPDLYQLSVFRSTGKRPFSPNDTAQFSALANFVVASAVKHDAFRQLAAGIPRHLDVEAIEQLLQCIPGNLSRRETQVCARVIAGMTIDGTASDLAIQRTSVVTYRQRAYAKLNISRQNELVALVNNLRREGNGLAS